MTNFDWQIRLMLAHSQTEGSVIFRSTEEKTKLENFINCLRAWCDSENPQIFRNSLDQILP
jgi:hypothetical protein